MANPFPFIIREIRPPGRAIILKGRSLPYRGVNFDGEQRVNVNYLPGNPVATAQIVGPVYTPTTIQGRWSDAFLFLGGPNPNANAAELRNFPNIGAAGLPDANVAGGQTFPSAQSVPGNLGFAQRARTLRDAVELLRRSGQLLKVEWGSIARVGFIRRTSFRHDREEDINWEIEFEWIGDTDAQPQIRTRQDLDALGLLRALIDQIQALIDAFDRAVGEIFANVQVVTQAITRIGSLATDLLESLDRFASLTLVPAELFGTLQQQLTRIRIETRDLISTLQSVPPSYQAHLSGDPTQVNLAPELTAAVIRNARILGAEAAINARQLDELQSDDLLGVYVSPGTVTLRDVATRFYGTPENWTRIKSFNGLSSSTVSRGTVVRVPRID